MPQSVDRICEAILAFLMAAIVALISASVGFRYVLLAPIAWGEELARLCLVWVSFLGVYVAYRRGQHIAVEAIADRLPFAWRITLRLAIALLTLALMGCLVWFGSRFAVHFMNSRTPLLGIPLGVVYAAMPVSMAMLMVDLALSTAREIRSLIDRTAGDGDPG